MQDVSYSSINALIEGVKYSESDDFGMNLLTSATTPNDVNSSSKIVLARTTKIVASVSALIIGTIIYGVTSLERMSLLWYHNHSYCSRNNMLVTKVMYCRTLAAK